MQPVMAVALTVASVVLDLLDFLNYLIWGTYYVKLLTIIIIEGLSIVTFPNPSISNEPAVWLACWNGCCCCVGCWKFPNMLFILVKLFCWNWLNWLAGGAEENRLKISALLFFPESTGAAGCAGAAADSKLPNISSVSVLNSMIHTYSIIIRCTW